MSQTMLNEKKKFKFPIWGWFYVFFGILFIANGFLVYFANTSFSGVTNDRAYVDGINYNEELERRAMQEEQGWQFGFLYDGAEGLQLNISSDAFNAQRLATSMHDVSVTFYRPTHEGHDFTKQLEKSGADNHYKLSNISFPLKGQWDVEITANFENKLYKYSERIVVK